MFVPKDLQRYIGKKELRYSLRTGYLGLAKQKARYIAGQVQSIFRLLRKGNLMANFSDDEINELVNNYIKESLERINNLFIDDPDEIRISRAAAFLGQKPVVGVAAPDGLDDFLLRQVVHFADEVIAALRADLDAVHVTSVIDESRNVKPGLI